MVLGSDRRRRLSSHSWSLWRRRTPGPTLWTPPSLSPRLSRAVALLSTEESGSSSSLGNDNDGDDQDDRDDRPQNGGSSSSSLPSLVRRRLRRNALHASLHELQLDADALESAAYQSLERPVEGYDGRFGKSAIKAYRSFVYPKRLNPSSLADPDASDNDDDGTSLAASAARCARQIEFLWRRHRSHQAEWVRHHDAPPTPSDPAIATSLSSSVSSLSPKSRFPLVLILDNLRSAWNVGSLFRTADAAGCEAVLTVGIAPHPGGNGADKVAKTALGAHDAVPHHHFATLNAALQHVRTVHPSYEVVALETTQRSVPYTAHDFAKAPGTILVVGNEVTGVSADLLDQDGAVDVLVEIPMYGIKNSLNVAACAPIVLYEIIRQREGHDTKN